MSFVIIVISGCHLSSLLSQDVTCTKIYLLKKNRKKRMKTCMEYKKKNKQQGKRNPTEYASAIIFKKLM